MQSVDFDSHHNSSKTIASIHTQHVTCIIASLESSVENILYVYKCSISKISMLEQYFFFLQIFGPKSWTTWNDKAVGQAADKRREEFERLQETEMEGLGAMTSHGSSWFLPFFAGGENHRFRCEKAYWNRHWFSLSKVLRMTTRQNKLYKDDS